MADGVAESKIFPEGEDGEDGNSDGHGPGGGKKNNDDSDGHENERGEDAGESHRSVRPLNWDR